MAQCIKHRELGHLLTRNDEILELRWKKLEFQKGLDKKKHKLLSELQVLFYKLFKRKYCWEINTASKNFTPPQVKPVVANLISFWCESVLLSKNHQRKRLFMTLILFQEFSLFIISWSCVEVIKWMKRFSLLNTTFQPACDVIPQQWHYQGEICLLSPQILHRWGYHPKGFFQQFLVWYDHMPLIRYHMIFFLQTFCL